MVLVSRFEIPSPSSVPVFHEKGCRTPKSRACLFHNEEEVLDESRASRKKPLNLEYKVLVIYILDILSVC